MAPVFMEWATVKMVRNSTFCWIRDDIWLQIYDHWSLKWLLTALYVMPMKIMCDVWPFMKSNQGTESHSIHDSPDVSSKSARRFLNTIYPFCAAVEARESIYASCKGRGSSNNCRSLELKHKNRFDWQGEYYHQHDYSRGSALVNREKTEERNG